MLKYQNEEKIYSGLENNWQFGKIFQIFILKNFRSKIGIYANYMQTKNFNPQKKELQINVTPWFFAL